MAHSTAAGGGQGWRLRWTGPLPPRRAVHLARQTKLTAVLTLGPYRVVNVGRAHPTLPAWLRTALETIHRHCRGPDCDRPAAWTQAHHVDAYHHGADTDLNNTVPLCKAHHDLITAKRWHMTLDPGTAACTWTSREGTTRTSHPPPQRQLVGASCSRRGREKGVRA